MDPDILVRELFARVRVRDESVADLYAETAEIVFGDVVHSGRGAILNNFYRPLFQGDSPSPEVQTVFSQGDLFIALVSVTMPGIDTPFLAADAFTVSNGEILQLRVCLPNQTA